MKILAGGTLVTPEGSRRGDIAFEGGRIVALEDHIEPGAGDEVEGVAGCWVFPGFIDAHTHLQCWTGMDWTADSFETGSRAAACGGTTTFIDYATADRGVRMEDALAEWHRRAESGAGCTANYGFHMALSEWSSDAPRQLRAMREAGVSSFKAYFAYDHLRLTDAEMLELLACVHDLDALLCVHCENGDVINELQKQVLAKGITGPEGHALSRPAEAEADAVSRLLYLASIAGARVNVVHLSSTLGLDAVRAARARGQQGIYVETCPQYLTLDDARYREDGFNGAKYVMSPPLRKPADIRALREAVCGGEVDTIATDHCSFNLAGQKERGRGDFTKIPNGAPGIEHRPAVIATTFENELSARDFCRLMAEGPAKVFGMWPHKGRLSVGADADVCVWDPSARWTIRAADQHQAVDYTPWEGFEAHGRAHLVYVNGELVARDGEPTGAAPGTFVPRA